MMAPMPKAAVRVLMCVMRDAHCSCSAASGGVTITWMEPLVRFGRISGTETSLALMPPMDAKIFGPMGSPERKKQPLPCRSAGWCTSKPTLMTLAAPMSPQPRTVKPLSWNCLSSSGLMASRAASSLPQFANRPGIWNSSTSVTPVCARPMAVTAAPSS